VRGVSLFSNIGIGELGLDEKNFSITHANEIEENRCKLYETLHPKTIVLSGDIRKKDIFSTIAKLDYELDFLISTPPCQGMSTAGKNEKYDPRNHLIKYSIDYIKKCKPKYVLHENVSQQENTMLSFKNRDISIPEYIFSELSQHYHIVKKKINMHHYGIPQSRKRSIYLLTRKDIDKIWTFPNEVKKRKNLNDVIGDLPSLDPYITGLNINSIEKIFPDFKRKIDNGLKCSPYHSPVAHPLRQILVMQNAPTACSAFQNESKFKPRTKEGRLVKGFNNTYKRMDWNKPSPTITTYNRTISSQENVHPGKKVVKKGRTIFSDARVLTLYEIMIIMTIPKKTKFSAQFKQSFIRSVIGEGIPSKFVKHLFTKLIK
jgi:DNA (cytosine-5)-methyltransferase 1